MVDRSSLQPKPCSAARTMLHALEYAMFMEAAAARREWFCATAPQQPVNTGTVALFLREQAGGDMDDDVVVH